MTPSYRNLICQRFSRPGQIIIQDEDKSNRGGVDFVSLMLNTTGCISIDINVTNRPRNSINGDWQFDFMVVLEDDIKDALSKCFSFAAAYWKQADRFNRYDRMIWNTSLGNLKHRNLVKQRPQGSSISVSFAENDKVMLAFDIPRSVNRVDFPAFDVQINAALSLFKRRFKQGNQY